MKWILLTFVFVNQAALASTFIGNGGQTGDVELAVSLKQVRAATDRIETLRQEDPNKQYCVCPENYADHNLCELIQRLTDEQKKYCDKFVVTQLQKLTRATHTTQFEWVQSTMVNQNKIGERVVDAVAQKDKKLIYIDQQKFVDLTQSKRMFLLTHELFHMDSFDGKNLDDEDPIGPFKYQYGIRDLLNAAAAGITLTSIDETVFQDYTKYLNQSRSTRRHWVSLMTPSTSLQDERRTRFETSMGHGVRFSYQYQFPNLYNFGLTLNLQNQSGEKTIFTSSRIKQKNSIKAVGITYRYFLFNNLDLFNQFWNTFVQFEILTERLDASFDMDDGYTTEQSTASSTSPAGRISVYFPMKHDFWINTGVSFSDHKVYFQEFDYNLSSNGPTFFLGVAYGF